VRVFTKFSPSFWNYASIRALGVDPIFLMLYLITNGHQNACGCYPLPDGYAISDIQWSLEKYHSARTALVDSKLILFDADTSEILVVKWFRHNPAMNPSHRKAIVGAIEGIASESLRAAAWQGLIDAEAEARAKQEAKAANAAAASGSPLLRTPHLARIK